MTKKRTKNTEKKDTRSRKVQDLAAKPLTARKAASVKGGMEPLTIQKVLDKSSPGSF